MSKRFYLEGFQTGTNIRRRYHLDILPVTIGRAAEATIQLATPNVSRVHAELSPLGEYGTRLQVRDLNSTNGVFVNHRRIVLPTEVEVGDVLHFADQEFLLGTEELPEVIPATEMTWAGIGALSKQFPTQAREFFDLLKNGRVVAFAQPIVDTQGRLKGYELLGRGNHPDINASPGSMFDLARAFGAEVVLSELLRRKSFEQAAQAQIRLPLFFNSHPKECENLPQLIGELSTLRQAYPGLDLVFEVHEAAVTDAKGMVELRAALQDLDSARTKTSPDNVNTKLRR